MADEELSLDQLQAKGAKFGAEPTGDGEELDLEQLQAKGAKFESRDMGPESRRALSPSRGMRPELAEDDEVNMLDPKHSDGRRYLSKDEHRQQREAENPLKNDLIGQGIVGSAMVAPAAALASGGAAALGVGRSLSTLAGGVTAGALSDTDDPLRGAVLGAIPGLPSAARGAGRAVERAAVARSAAGKSFVPAATAAGTAAGTMVGHGAVPYVGAPIGAALGAKGGAALGRAGDRLVGRLADRHVMRSAQAAPMIPPAELEAILAQTEPARPPLAPLTPQGPSFEQRSARFVDEISGDLLTNAGKPSPLAPTHATVGEGTAVLPKPSFAEDVVSHTKNGKTLAEAVKAAEDGPSLREQVSRDAKANVKGPGGGPWTPPGGADLADTLKASIEMAQKLRAAKAAGTLTPEMVKAAREAGMSPAFIKQLGGATN